MMVNYHGDLSWKTRLESKYPVWTLLKKLKPAVKKGNDARRRRREKRKVTRKKRQKRHIIAVDTDREKGNNTNTEEEASVQQQLDFPIEETTAIAKGNQW